ncbi:MAG: TonB-dependent receptor, partial [Bacteroidetes bacterium]
MKKSLLLLLACTGLLLPAQSSVEVSGKIIDAETRLALPGATVYVSGTTKGALADKAGSFTFPSLPAGKTTLIVRHIGYQADTLPLDLGARPREYVIIALQSGDVQADTVQIKGQLQGQMRALSQQRNAANIQNVVSVEQIEQFPDMNAAEAILRIPGITLQRDQGEGRFV